MTFENKISKCIRTSTVRYILSIFVALFASSVISISSFAGCGSLTIAEMNWASAELMANVDKIILEKGPILKNIPPILSHNDWTVYELKQGSDFRVFVGTSQMYDGIHIIDVELGSPAHNTLQYQTKIIHNLDHNSRELYGE